MPARIRRLALLALAVLLAGCSSGGDRLTSDAVLRERFEQHRAAFDSLAAAAVADTGLLSVRRVASLSMYVRGGATGDSLLTEEGIRATGRSHYERLLADAGVDGFSRQGSEPRVSFVLSTNGRLLKGLVHTWEPLDPQRPSLDGLEAAGSPPTAYVSIAPGWYLFVEPTAED